MIQVGSIVDVIDNSGAKRGCCIKVITGYKGRYASLGDLLLVSIKRLRNKRKVTSKVTKGSIYKGVVVNTSCNKNSFSGEKISFSKNCIILFNKQKKPIGTRVLNYLPLSLRYKGFLRVLSMSNGIIL